MRPPPRVIVAFGVTGDPERAAGGRKTAWAIGDTLVKPLDLAPEELEWQAALFESIRCEGFRVSRPKRAVDGSLTIDGWCAWERLEGAHAPARWSEIIDVGNRFHAALAGVPRPSFIDRRKDPWAIGDRAAWGDLPVQDFIHVKHLPRLAEALRPVEAASQLIHGDLTGNVLFADRLPPAIIDFSPYWRPTAFASAIVVADALVWEGADERILDAVAEVHGFEQFLLRALIYRAVTDRLFRQHEPIRPDDADPYLPAVDLACRLAAAR